MFSRLQTFLLSLGAFLRPKNGIAFVLWMCRRPFLSVNGTRLFWWKFQHRSIKKWTRNTSHINFVLSSLLNISVFFLLSNTLSLLHSISITTDIISRPDSPPPLPHPTLDPQIIGTGHETGIASEEAIYLELYTVTWFFAPKKKNCFLPIFLFATTTWFFYKKITI
jgi:hypothetical protein